MSDPFASAPSPATSFSDAFARLNQYGSSSAPDPLAGTPAEGLPEFVTLADGRRMSAADLARMGETGAKLLNTARRIKQGEGYGFLDAFSSESVATMLPFFGMFASVGGDISGANQVRDYYQKRLRGEPTTDEEALKATLYGAENQLRTDGTFGYTVGSIVKNMPGFMGEMGILGSVVGAGRTALAASAVRGADAGAAARFAFNTALKTGTRESAMNVVRSYVSASGKTAAEATAELLSSKVAMRSAVDEVVRSGNELISTGVNAVRGFKPKWAPGLLDKSLRYQAERDVRAAASLLSSDSKMVRYWKGAWDSMSRAAKNGLMDAGSWGTDASTILTTAEQSWKRAALDGLTELTVGAGTKGLSLFAPRLAVSKGLEAAFGATSRAELDLIQAAGERGDRDLMDSAWLKGMALDLMEYVSENTGRGFNSLFRAAGMKLVPSLVRPARRIAGVKHVTGATVKRTAAGEVENVTFNGIVEQARHAEVGSRLGRMAEQRFGARAMDERVVADKYRAVEWALGKKGIVIDNPAALEATIARRSVQPGLSEAVVKELGPNPDAYARSMVKAYNKAGLEGMKFDHYFAFATADFVTRRGWDPLSAWNAFSRAGYDGVFSEMLEERYNDVAQALFGLNAEQDQSFKARLKRAWEAKWPGMKQFLAEMIGFSVPMLARAGAMRGLAALGGKNAFERRIEWASLERDAERFGIGLQQQEWGTYLKSFAEQRKRLSGRLTDVTRKYDDAKAKGDTAAALQYELEKERSEDALKRADDFRKAFYDSLSEGQLAKIADMDQKVANLRSKAATARTSAQDAAAAGDTTRAEAFEAEARSYEDAAAAEELGGPMVVAPAVADEVYLRSRAEFSNQAFPTEDQARRQLSAAQMLAEGAADYAQGSYMAENRTEDEDLGWFRRAARWVAESALRLGGFAATTDFGFLSENPLEWNAVDRGAKSPLLVQLKNRYGEVYARKLEEIEQRNRNTPRRGTADMRTAHAEALDAFRGEARNIVNDWLALKQVRMFSNAELRDFALDSVARSHGLYVDPDTMTVRKANSPDSDPVPVAKFADEHAKEVDAELKHESRLLYMALTAGEGANRVALQERNDGWDPAFVLSIPADLPTADQALLVGMAGKLFKGLRQTCVAIETRGERLASDELAASSVVTTGTLLDSIRQAILPNGMQIASSSDLEAALGRAEDVHPSLIAAAARDLGYDRMFDGTKAGVEARNRAVVRHAVLESVAEDPDTKVFTRPVSARSVESDRIGAAQVTFVLARRRPDGKWYARPYDTENRRADRDIAADTFDGLARMLQADPFNYRPAESRIVYGSAETLTAADPLHMIRALNLGDEYLRMMQEAGGGNEFLDPLVRKDAEGEYYDSAEAERIRAAERLLNEDYERAKGQSAEAYLLPGESTSDSAAMARAAELRRRAEEAHDHMYSRHDSGKAVGYMAVADDLLAMYGVIVPGRGGVAAELSPAFRGKYVFNAKAMRMIGATADTYIPIDHANAQSYESAILGTALERAFVRHRGFIEGELSRAAGDSLKAFDRTMASMRDSLAGTDADLSRQVEELRLATVAGAADKTRKLSPITFSTFVSAFNLFRTEFDAEHLVSELGPHAAALKAVAPLVRELPEYVSWTGFVDRVLGGDGFEPELLAATNRPPEAGRGLARFWSLFAPAGSGTLWDAVKASMPKNENWNGFVDRVTASLAAAANPGAAVTNTTPPAVHAGLGLGNEVEFADVAQKDPLAVLHAMQEAVVKSGADSDAVNAALSSAETRASEGAGETEDLPEGTVEDVSPVAPAQSEPAPEARSGAGPAASSDGTMSPPHVPVPALAGGATVGYTESEARMIVNVVASISRVGDDGTPDLQSFRYTLSRLAPHLRDADREALETAFQSAVDSAETPESLWSDETDEDEEGILPDGFEGSNSHSVAMLRSQAMRQLNALASLVSPMTGRDLQPFLEDVRAMLDQFDSVFPKAQRGASLVDGGEALDSAMEYVRWLLEPTREDVEGGSAERDALFYARLTMMDSAEGRRKVAGHMKALMEPLSANGAPVFGKAASLLGYLLHLSRSAATRPLRDQVAKLLGEATASDPLRIGLDFTRPADGSKPVPVMSVLPATSRRGTVSVEAVTSSFARLAGRTHAELLALRDDLAHRFAEMARRGEFDMSRGLWTRKGTGVMNAWARLLAPVFGADSPLVSLMTARNMYARMRVDHLRGAKSDIYDSVVSRFSFPKGRSGNAPALQRLIDIVNEVAFSVEGASRSSMDVVASASVGVFVNGSKFGKIRTMDSAVNSLHGESEWLSLMEAYAEAKPRSIMTGETDPERTSRPSTSVAITMVGREPALQMFLDRKEGNDGLVDVAKKWFGWDKLSDAQVKGMLADLRVHMVWPDASRTRIVAKNLSKSLFGDEVAEACRTSYRAETDPGFAKERLGDRFESRNMVYVPLFSGDHSSSILVQVPLARQFAEKGMDWDAAAEMVAKWFGLDLLGVDPKRSSLTSFEAPAVSMAGTVVDRDGRQVLDDSGKPVRGHNYVGVVWNSAPGANNEAYVGSAHVFGYAATRLHAMAKDPRSQINKFHMLSTADDAVYGPSFTFNKALYLTQDTDEPEGGQFTEGTSLRILSDFANGFVADPKLDSLTLMDADAAKIGLVNNKTVGPDAGDGKMGNLMTVVLEAVNAYIEAGNEIPDSGFDSAKVDEIVGKVKWIDLTGRRERESELLVSQILEGAEVRKVTDTDGGRMLVFTWRQDNVMAFTAANVSHASQPGTSPMSRNYVVDMLAMSRTLETWSANVADPGLVPDTKEAGRKVRDCISAYALAAACLAQDEQAIDNLLAADEEYARAESAARGLVPGGQSYGEFARSAYSSWLRKNLMNAGLNCIPAALVSNAAWIGDDGRAHSHSKAQWFNDLLQGARTIEKSERMFWGANKRRAICNVNCRASGFRYGLYVDVQKLEDTFLGRDVETSGGVFRERAPAYLTSLADERAPFADAGADPAKRAAVILEAVITAIDQAKTGTAEKKLREMLGGCLYDHRGVYLSDRKWFRTRTYRDKATGKTVKKVDPVSAAQDVSFRDLFYRGRDGKLAFDRSAVYDGMHDREGRETVYLGGTLFGFPRTPSYNGSMWDQCVRAGIPVTECAPKDHAEQWVAGYDAMVAPDPYTLAILGCDHDGDKSHLYMLSSARTEEADDIVERTLGGPLLKAVADAASAVLEGDPTTVAETRRARVLAAARRYAESLIGGEETWTSARTKLRTKERNSPYYETTYKDVTTQTGVVRYAERDGKPAGLEFTPSFQRAMSDFLVRAMFGMNHALPVLTDRGGEPVLGSAERSEANSGSMFSPTKFTLVPGKKQMSGTSKALTWEQILDRSKAPILDIDAGRTIGKPGVSAAVQKSAMYASLSRAIIVGLNRTLHMAFMSGLPVGPSYGDNPGRRFVDFMYHMDGLANMTFDDLKNQLCSRLGVTPYMVETIVASMIVDGRALTTDREFAEAFVKYVEDCKTPGTALYEMTLASDPGNYDYRVESYKTVTGSYPYIARGEKPPVLRADDIDKFAGFPDGRDAGEPVPGSAAEALFDAADAIAAETPDYDAKKAKAAVLGMVLGGASRLGGPGLGALLYVARLTAGGRKYSAMNKAEKEGIRRVVKWAEGMSVLADAKAFRSLVDWAAADPLSESAPSSAAEEGRKWPATAPTEADGEFLNRMHAARMLMNGGVAETCAQKGVRLASEAYDAADGIVMEWARSSSSDQASAVFVSSLAACPVLRRYADPMALERNVQTVPYSLAAFLTMPEAEDGTGFLTKAGAWQTLYRAGAAMGGAGNVTLGVRRFVESAVELMARAATTDFRTHDLAPIFNFLRLRPDAGAYQYSPHRYGGSAKGLARVELAMGSVTEDQLDAIREVLDRVLAGELDGKGLAISSESLARLESDKDVKKAASRLESLGLDMSGLEGNEAKAAAKAQMSALAEGRASNVSELVKSLKAAFQALDGAYKKDFVLEPSALFGQVLPLYAALTCPVEGPVSADTHSILALYPDYVQAWEAKIVELESNPFTKKVLGYATAVDFSPNVYGPDTPAAPTAFDVGGRIAETGKPDDVRTVAVGSDIGETGPARGVKNMLRSKGATKGMPRTRENPRYRTTVAAFDDVRGVFFQSALRALSGQIGADWKRAEAQPLPKPEPAPDPSSGASAAYVNHSGGATGSDAEWGLVGAEYGVRSNHYQFEGAATPNGNVTLPMSMFAEGMEHVAAAVKPLGRKIPADAYVQKLLARNWYQVKNSDAVFAISKGFDEKGNVLGGTGWAVEMAKEAGKPIFVFDQPSGKWSRWTGSSWEAMAETPKLTKNFAGIGTRVKDLTDAGRAAIRDVYRNTFGATPFTPVPAPVRASHSSLAGEFAGTPGVFIDAMRAAREGLTLEEAAALNAQLGNVRPVFTPEEIAQIKQALGGRSMWVTSASRRTDVAFFRDKFVKFLEDNAKKPFTDPTRINAVEIWSKHDGLPVRDMLEACRKYKVAPMMSFSVTTLGGTAYEPGVLKAEDLARLVGELIEDGVLNPSTTTLRLDPLVPGVTKIEDVKRTLQAFYDLGIRKVVTSVMQSYGFSEGATGADGLGRPKDKKVVQRMNEAHRKATGADYDWDRYYGRQPDGKVRFEAKTEAIRPFADAFKEFMASHGDMRIQSCAFNRLGLRNSACLDPYVLERVTGVDVFDENGKYPVVNPMTGKKERPDCDCYGPHADILRYDDRCRSACMYCYAAQDISNPISYYRDDGTLISEGDRDYEFATARREAPKPAQAMRPEDEFELGRRLREAVAAQWLAEGAGRDGSFEDDVGMQATLYADGWKALREIERKAGVKGFATADEYKDAAARFDFEGADYLVDAGLEAEALLARHEARDTGPTPAEEDTSWHPEVAAVADRMRAVMQLWDAGNVEYSGGTKFKITGKFHRDGILSGDAAFDTEIEVSVEDRPSDVTQLTDAEVLTAIAKTGSTMTLKDFRELPGATQAAYLSQWASSGRYVAGFRRGANTVFSVTPEQLGVVTGRITLYRGPDGRFDPNANSAFHEFFHASMSFVRAVGGLRAEDLEVLRRKYGEHPAMSGWFNEEKAADDFRRIVEEEVEPMPVDPETGRPAVGEKRGAEGVLERILYMLRSLYDMLFKFARRWTSDAYGNDMEDSPLLGIALTGRVRESISESVQDMDLDGKLDYAAARYLDWLDRLRDQVQGSFVVGTPDDVHRLDGTVNDVFSPLPSPADPPFARLRESDAAAARPMDLYKLASATQLPKPQKFGPTFVPDRFSKFGKTNMDRRFPPMEPVDDMEFRTGYSGGTSSRVPGLASPSRMGERYAGELTGWTREELVLNAIDRAAFPAGRTSREAVEALLGVLDRLRDVGRDADPESRARAVMDLEAEYESDPLASKILSGLGRFLATFGPSMDGKAVKDLAAAVVSGPASGNQLLDAAIARSIQPPAAAGMDAPPVDLGDEVAMADVAPVTPKIREIVSDVRSLRMNRPYAKMYVVANAVGRAIRSRFGDAASVQALERLPQLARTAASANVRRVAETAVRETLQLYGAEVSDEKLRNVLFSAMVELYSMANGMIDPAAGGRVGEAGPHARDDQQTKRNLSGLDLVAAVATSTGARPRDVAEAGLADVNELRKKYGPETTFSRNVLDRCAAALEMAAEADPAKLVTDLGYMEAVVGSALSGLRAGLRNGPRAADGTFGDYELITSTDKTANMDAVGDRYNPGNYQLYYDHVKNPDFQAVMKKTLSRLFTIAASVKFYRQIGLTPGDPADTAAARALAPYAPEPLTAGDAMAAFNVSEVRFADEPDLSAADFYCQPWFMAQHPDAWLDSLVRPSFGGIDLRESQKGARDAAAGLQRRVAFLNTYQARLLGLDVLPGNALTEMEEAEAPEFEQAGGVTRVAVDEHGKRKTRKRVKFNAYSGRKAKDPKAVVTVNGARWTSLRMDAITVWAKGSRKLVTGVDGITFSVNDSADASHYEWEKVKARAGKVASGGYSDFDRALLRLMRQWHDDLNGEHWEGVTGPSGLNMYQRLVDSACRALKYAQECVKLPADNDAHMDESEVNAFVLESMARDGLVVTHDVKRDGRLTPSEATVCLDVEEIEREYTKPTNEGYGALLAGGRKPEQLTREALAKPMLALAAETRRFCDDHPWLSDGDGAFFHDMTTPLPFVRGNGFFMYMANRRERSREDDVASAKREFEEAFERASLLDRMASVPKDSDALPYLVRILFHVPERDAESVRRTLAEKGYPQHGIPAGANAGKVMDAVYRRLVEMEWYESGDPVLKEVGGRAAVSRMAAAYERMRRREDEDGTAPVVSGGRGMTDENVYRMTGCLPANHQLGHAVQHMVNGLTNAVAFRAAVFNMMTTPDREGLPVCIMDPSETAERDGGITDAMWGAAARWWSETLKLGTYDPARSGVENAHRAYRAAKDRFGKDRSWGHLNPGDIDVPSVDHVMAKRTVPDGESSLDYLGGGYALGYAKHLFQATRALGSGWVRTLIHRSLAYSKSMAVSFSYFFPLATRFESPIGAMGAVATLGGNFAPGKLRGGADSMAQLRKILKMDSGWITKDFIGQRDVFDMLDSDDPYLADLVQFASSIGLGLSDANANVLENQRGILQADLKKSVGWVRRTYGAKAAAKYDSFMRAVFVRGGEKAFTYHLNATKLAVAAQMCQMLRFEAAKRGLAFDPVRDMRRYAPYINAEIGGVDPLEYAWAHPKAQSLLSALMFSWNWTRGAWEAGGGKVIEQVLFGGHQVTPEERNYYLGRWLRMGLWIVYGLPFVMQLACKALAVAIDPDHEDREDEPWFTWQNESRGWLTSFDMTPLLRAVGKRFPSYAKWASDHPFLASVPLYAGIIASKRPLAGVGAALATPWRDPDADDGRKLYGHLGKQAHEVHGWFDDPWRNFASKQSMVLQKLEEGFLGRSMSFMERALPWANMGIVERWFGGGATTNLLGALLPFSVAGLVDGEGGGGGLTAFFPVRKGLSRYAAGKRMEEWIDRWASNDRRGYAPGKLPREAYRKGGYSKFMAGHYPTPARLVRELRMNGVPEKQAYAVVGNALQNLMYARNRRFDGLMPEKPDGDYDVQAVNRVMREYARLGKTTDDVYKAYKKRMEDQERWHKMELAARQRNLNIIRRHRRNPYEPEPEPPRPKPIDY